MNTKPSFSYGIKGKLISAVSMLLVACIMVVSSTYAWFTLSTAPEVTGISTAIGANGALEIKLNDSRSPNSTNATWGNLVDLGGSDAVPDPYGLQKIILLPSALNLEASATVPSVKPTAPLKYPEYGPDGRPSDAMKDAMLGVYNNTDFMPFTDGTTGVVAVGMASGMTPRQLAYRNARTAATSAMKGAINAVDTTMRAEGGTLANIVINKVLLDSANVTLAQLNSLKAIVDSLDTALNYVEDAYEQQIIAAAASAAIDQTNPSFATVDAALRENFYLNVQEKFTGGMTIKDVVFGPDNTADTSDDGTFEIGEGANPVTCTVPAELLKGMKDYVKTQGTVATARTTIGDLIASAGTTDPTANAAAWNEVQPVLNNLINYGAANAVTVNGMDISAGSAIKDQLVNKIIADGFKVNLLLGANSGVYEELADQVGNFSVNIVIYNLQAGGFTVSEFPANMATDSSVVKENQGNSYLSLATTAVGLLQAPASTGGASQPLTEFYGYRLDFAFQTNAAGSNLLLQTKPVDRIYSGNANELTQGGGSTMTFKAATSALKDEHVLGLMAAIRVVFYETGSGKILAEARLDTRDGQYTVGADGITANLYLYQAGYTKYELTYTPTDAAKATTVTVYKSGENYYTSADFTESSKVLVGENKAVTGAVAGTDGTIASVEVAGSLITSTEDKNLDAVITALQQNTAMYVSALLYLDGEELENKDVAYDDAKSVTGMLNLQFASSADLVPMEYGGLHTPGETKYKVTYDLNGATGNPPAVAEVAKDAKANLPATLTDVTAPADKQYFLGWNTNKDATEALTEYTVIADVTLYAIWSATDPNAAATP